MSLTEGQLAPDFSLPGHDGRQHSLAKYKGHTVVLYFYPKDDTPGCTKEACGFRDRDKEFALLNTKIFGVSKDGIDSHSLFAKKFELPFVLLTDPSTEMIQAYGAWGEKNMYGKISHGIIRSTVIINKEGKVAKIWPKIKDAEQHPEEVLEALKSLLAP